MFKLNFSTKIIYLQGLAYGATNDGDDDDIDDNNNNNDIYFHMVIFKLFFKAPNHIFYIIPLLELGRLL